MELQTALIEIAVGVSLSAILGSISAYVAIRVKLASMESHITAKFAALDDHIELLRNDYRGLADRVDSVIGKL